MWASCGKRQLFLTVVVGMCGVLSGNHAAESPESVRSRSQTVFDDPNDLRWDLAEAFRFAWESTESSAKIVQGTSPSVPSHTAIISVGLTILDPSRLVVLDVENPGICRVLDQDGNSVDCEPMHSEQARCYRCQTSYWDQGKANDSKELVPFSIEVRLPTDTRHAPVYSISLLEGYIYAVYADEVIKVDIPFDPDGGWIEPKTAPDLIVRVDPTTPPCPGPLRFVNVPLADPLYGPRRPATPVPLYIYQTRVKSKTGGPMMGLYDPGVWYARSLFPLGEYVVVRTELCDSRNKTSVHTFTQWIVGDSLGYDGARCNGQMKQGPGDTYDSIRHVIAVRPVEVKIPFVLKNVPVPTLLPLGIPRDD